VRIPKVIVFSGLDASLAEEFYSFSERDADGFVPWGKFKVAGAGENLFDHASKAFVRIALLKRSYNEYHKRFAKREDFVIVISDHHFKVQPCKLYDC
jgi:hypothetical protein